MFSTKMLLAYSSSLAIVQVTTGVTSAYAQAVQQSRPSDVAVDDKNSQTKPSNQTPAESSDIVVTGFRNASAANSAKLNIPLAETPQSITVISGAVIQSIGAREIVQAVNYFPGVNALADSSSGGQPQIQSRGFSISESSGYKLDGLSLGDNLPIDPIVAERVEFVKGANSIAFGQVSPGGILNIIGKQPGSEFGGTYEVGGGLYGYGRIAGDVGGPVTTDGRLGIRVGGAYTQSSVSYENEQSRQYALFAAARYELTPNLTISARGIFQSHSSRPNSLLGLYRFSSDPLSLDLVDSYPTRLFRNENFASDKQRFDVEQIVADQSLGGGWHLIVTGARSRSSVEDHFAGVYQTDETMTGFAKYDGGFDTFAQTQLQIEARVQGKISLFGRSHDISLFSEYTHNTRNERASTYANYDSDLLDEDGFPIPVAADPGQAQNDPALINNFTLDYSGGSKKHLLAFGGNMRLNVAGPLKLILGGRLDMFYRRNFEFSYPDGVATPTSSDTSAYTINRFSPRAALVVQPLRHLNIYYSYSQSADYTTQTTCPFTNGVRTGGRSLPAIVGTQHEIGAKEEMFGGRLLITAAIFHIEQKNNPVGDNQCVNEVGDYANGSLESKARSRGAEFEIIGNITPQLNVVGGLSYTDADTIDGAGQVPENVGLANVPKYRASLFMRYDISNGRYHGLGFGAGANYVGRRPVDSYGSFMLPARTQFDAAVYYKLNRRFELSVNLTNLTDTRIYDSAYADPSGGLTPRDRRTITAAIRGNF